MNEWQLIATAPKDGTRVLAWQPSKGTFVAMNFGHGWHTDPSVHQFRPTHWMPLPADPPSEAPTP